MVSSFGRLGSALVMALLGLALCGPSPSPSQEGPKQKSKRYNQREAADVVNRLRRNYVPLRPAGARVAPNVVEVTLAVSIKIHEIDTGVSGRLLDRVRTRSYNCSLCGPVIRVRPGDQLKVHLRNDIKRSEWDKEFDPANPTAPHGFNVTNLHTHGLNVSPSGRSDNVFLEAGPEESLDLCFDIPKDHPCGTFWYHAHKHGSVALQLAGGMAGVLVVEGGKGSLDDDPAVAAATAKEHEKILVFQQIPYVQNDSGAVVDVRWEDVYSPPAGKIERAAAGTLVRNTLVNGGLLPTIAMRPGEVQRWRCVHAGLEDTLNLALVKAGPGVDLAAVGNRFPLHEIAVDGLPLGTLETWHRKPVELQPGYRSDLLVQAPEAGHYLLMSLPVDADRSITGEVQGTISLARVEVAGAAVTPSMRLPKATDLERYPKQQGLEPIVKVNASREIDFRSKDATKEYLVDREPFSRDRILFCPKLGDAEEWTLKPTAGFHPFHVHVNPFVVDRADEAGNPKPVWRDTLFISDEIGKVKVRTRFSKFAGKTVLHCHNLRHEDQGMMAAFRIDGPDTEKAACPKLEFGLKPGAAAPAWELLDAGKKPVRSEDYKGKKLLLVFSRGSGCVHCRDQVQKLLEKRAALAAAGLTVVVVSPVPPSALPPAGSFPFVALSDEWRVAFKDYGCHDGRALHGTYLIDSAGKVRFADAGDEPFMGIDALLKKAAVLK